MADDRPSRLPYDTEAEAAVIGAALLSPRDVLPGLTRILDPDAFYKPAHGFVWQAICDLYDDGSPVDAVTVSDALDRAGVADNVDHGLLNDVILDTPSVAAAGRYARIVIRHHRARQLVRLCSDTSNDALTGTDVEDLVHRLTDGVADLTASVELGPPSDLVTLDDWLDKIAAAGRTRLEYLIPGILTAEDRLILTAAEGVGKMVLLRQFVQLAAAGQHPLVPSTRIRPLITLLIDVENPSHAIQHTAGPVRAALRRLGDDTSSAWIFHRQEGIDLRSRRGRGEIEAVLQHVQPELVCAGPLYKLFDRLPGETDEQAAKAVQAVLDDLRTRHRFGLMLEHHVPHGPKATRDLRPFGSSAWQRWPEYGIGLRPAPREARKGAIDVERWRPDRIPATWPLFMWQNQPPYLWDSWFDLDPRSLWDDDPAF